MRLHWTCEECKTSGSIPVNGDGTVDRGNRSVIDDHNQRAPESCPIRTSNWQFTKNQIGVKLYRSTMAVSA